MIDTHIRIEAGLYNIIKNSSIKNSTSFNKECIRLLELGLSLKELLNKVDDVGKSIDRVSKNCYIVKRLLEQVYSDIGLSVTNVNESANLKAFYNNLKGVNFRD